MYLLITYRRSTGSRPWDEALVSRFSSFCLVSSSFEWCIGRWWGHCCRSLSPAHSQLHQSRRSIQSWLPLSSKTLCSLVIDLLIAVTLLLIARRTFWDNILETPMTRTSPTSLTHSLSTLCHTPSASSGSFLSGWERQAVTNAPCRLKTIL